MTSNRPLAQCLVPASDLHLTFFVLSLKKAAVPVAREMLESCADIVHEVYQGGDGEGGEGEQDDEDEAWFGQERDVQAGGAFLELAFPPLQGDPREEALSIEGLGTFRKDGGL